MTQTFASPQDAEDAFYDAIDDKDLDAMMAVWDNADHIACLLPMQPLTQGRVPMRAAWEAVLGGDFNLEIQVHHLQWIELGDVAVHYVQETATVSGQDRPQPPVYATNVYRKTGDSWHLVLHQNSPAPPPPGMMPGMQMPS